MLNKVCPRKDLYHYGEKRDGFFIDGANFDDCYKQLIQYGKEHPEKWIYYYDCGVNVGYPIPVATYILEVTVLDREPAGIMISRLFQKGCDGRREIDEMTDNERFEFEKKIMNIFSILGWFVGC